jgi:hypothetical protein
MTVEIMVSKDECIATARSPFQKAADGLIPKAASVGGHELHANDAVALARAHHESGCLPQFSNPSRFNNHHAVPEHLSKAQTAKVYDAGVQNRTAPQTICSGDPLRSLLFRRCRRRRLFAVWQASTRRSRQAARSMFEEAWTRIRPRYLVCHDRFSMFLLP